MASLITRCLTICSTAFQEVLMFLFPLFLKGFYICLIGPSLLDLQITANTTTKSMTMVFLGRSIGGMLGSVLYACILYRLNRWLVLAVSFSTMAAVMTSLPWLGHVIAMAVVYGIGGVAFNIADIGKMGTYCYVFIIFFLSKYPSSLWLFEYITEHIRVPFY